MSLVVVVHFGAGNALQGIEISIFDFIKLYLRHISKDVLLLQAQKAVKQMQTIFFQKAVMSRITKMQNW